MERYHCDQKEKYTSKKVVSQVAAVIRCRVAETEPAVTGPEGVRTGYALPSGLSALRWPRQNFALVEKI